MLITTILILIIYGSLKKEINKNNKIINRIGLIIILFSLLINIQINKIEELNTGINILNSLLLVNNINNIIINIIYIIILLYIILLSFNITNIKYIDKITTNKNSLIIIILFNLISLILLPLVNDIMLLYILIEFQSFTLYILTCIYNESYNSLKAGLFYFIIGSLGSLMILDGTIGIYEELGLTNFNYIFIYIDYINIYNILIIIIGLFIKIGLAPLFNYLIIIYTLSPTIITAYISLLPKLSILTLIYILYNYISLLDISNNINFINFNYIFIFLIIISMIIGGIGGLKTIKIKTLLGFSSLINISYILISFINNSNDTIIAYIFFIFQYSLTHFNIFYIILLSSLYIPIINNNFDKLGTKNNKLDQVNGQGFKFNESINKLNKLVIISKYSPIEYLNQFKYIYINNKYLTFAFSISLFSLIGIPPLIGFYSKFLIIISGLNNGNLFLIILLIFISTISCYYYAKIINILYFSNINNKFINNFENRNNTILYESNIITYFISLLTLITILIVLQYDNIIKGTYLVIFNNIY